MKKFLLFSFMALLGLQVSSQNWLTVSTAPFRTYFQEVIEFDGSLIAVGYEWNGQVGAATRQTPKVFRIEDSIWTEMGSGFGESYYTGVYAAAEFNSELYIAGDFSMDNGVDPVFSFVAKWDDPNERWVPVGDGTAGGEGVYELMVYNDSLYAGGDFDDLGSGGLKDNIAVWDGASWLSVGSGLSTAENPGEDPDQVKSMVVYDNKLYVGGRFTTAGGELVHNIAYWETGEWHRLTGTDVEGGGGVGNGYSGNVAIMAMAVFDGDLYIGGTFLSYYNGTYIGSSTPVSNHLVVWNGTSFSAPGQATPANNRVNAMAVYNDRIYIGNINESNIYSWDGSLFDWRLEPDRDPAHQRVTAFYANAMDLFYAHEAGLYMYADPFPAFSASSLLSCPSSEITFTDNSTASSTITAWNWTFEGGTPATSNEQNPVVTYTNKGVYDVTLTVTSSDGSSTITKEDYINVDDKINITQQPADNDVCSGTQALFSAFALTGADASVQWQYDPGTGFTDLENGGDNFVSGADATTLKYTPLAGEDGYTFRILWFNCQNSDTSDAATLSVRDTPEITQQPELSIALCESGDTAIQVMSEGSGTITYKWQYYTGSGGIWADVSDGAVYSGAATSKLGITGADHTLAELYDSDDSDGITSALYRALVSANGCGTYSTNAYLRVHDVPGFTEDLEDVAVCNTNPAAGVNASFSVLPTLEPAGLQYRWEVDTGNGFIAIVEDTVYSGSNTKQLTISNAMQNFSGNIYRVAVGNCSSPTTSSTATLTLDEKPVITRINSSSVVSICELLDTAFEISATGANTMLQWQRNTGTWTDLSDGGEFFGSTNSRLDISGGSTGLDNARFRVVATNGTCETTSSQYTLRVYSAPTFSGTITDRTTCDGGDPVAFSKGANGYNSNAHSYQWQVEFAGTGIYSDISDTSLYSGMYSTSLTIRKPSFSMNGNKYRLAVKGCGTLPSSQPATLTVKGEPVFIHSPQTVSANLNQDVTFSAKAMGEGLTYNWYVDDGISGYVVQKSSTDTFFTINNVQVDQAGWKVKAEVNNGPPCSVKVESLVAELNVPGASLGTQEFSGGTVQFNGNTVTAEVDSFYWSFGDGNNLGGVLNPSHSYAQNGSYNVCLVVIDKAGTEGSVCTTVQVLATGLDRADALAGLNIYPNPAKERLTIEQISEGDRILIYDIRGSKIMETEANADILSLDLSGISKGLYILKVTNRESTREVKFEKQ